MNNYKEKIFKGITYTAALFTIIFLFAIIASIFYGGAPMISDDLGPRVISVNSKEFERPWQIIEAEHSVRTYCEVYIDNEPADENDEIAAFIDGECRAIAGIIMEDDIALAVMDIQANKNDNGKTVQFAVYDKKYDDVFTVAGVAKIQLDSELGERHYPLLCECATPYLNPKPWQVIEYSSSTKIYCEITIEGACASQGDEVAAFIDDECRGIATVFIKDDKAYAELEIAGNKPETAKFAVFDSAEQRVLGSNTSIVTQPGTKIEELLNIDAIYYLGGEPQIFSRLWLPQKMAASQITTAYCRVIIDNENAEPGDELGVFVNGVCRSVAKITSDKNSLITLEIPSLKNELIQFAVWDKSESKVLGVHYNTISIPGGQIGNSPDKPIFFQYIEKFVAFVFGTSWHPTTTPGRFGILTLIVGSLLVTLGALIIAIPFGVGSAIYISEIASPKAREIIKPVIELLAGIPSVVYGLFGMAFLAPMLMKWFHISAGLNILNASIILGVMVIPIISSMSEDALSMVPKNLRHASYGLGANRWETIVKVILPAAKTGVISSILLGFGRAIGETMVVIMVAGGSPQFPSSIFHSVRPMTAAIASEMGETAHGTTHFHALYGIAVVLFLITFITNITSELVFHRQKKI
jgi:phosphate transport system permease protein